MVARRNARWESAADGGGSGFECGSGARSGQTLACGSEAGGARGARASAVGHIALVESTGARSGLGALGRISARGSGARSGLGAPERPSGSG